MRPATRLLAAGLITAAMMTPTMVTPAVANAATSGRVLPVQTAGVAVSPAAVEQRLKECTVHKKGTWRVSGWVSSGRDSAATTGRGCREIAFASHLALAV